ncbi:hypothetical protein W911_04765 [Hyphomicrobium nitrativorans NL23]|uniref:Uncharacterized protein n=1 Tax=Hyphomicrobium nitrativorans NL23 TaxID=1029756 RepID=V5SHF2_9HYPH|nr:hypothetical protein W911_04765 [Hyphomicrobium nitrativorans NL23]
MPIDGLDSLLWLLRQQAMSAARGAAVTAERVSRYLDAIGTMSAFSACRRFSQLGDDGSDAEKADEAGMRAWPLRDFR